MIKFLTAGESHGKALSGIIDNIPRGFVIDISQIESQLSLRKSGYGRSDRQSIETDKVEVLSGIYSGTTIGSPISFVIYNNDTRYFDGKMEDITAFRSGHIDVCAYNKYGVAGVRDMCEHASGRLTATTVVAGNICRQILQQLNVNISYKVINVGGEDFTQSQLAIDKARANGTSLGGQVEVVVSGLLAGLGANGQSNQRLDGIIASSMMSIPAVKAVEIGLGVNFAAIDSLTANDSLIYKDDTIKYASNNVGGICGGLTTGNDIVVRLTVKPVPTFSKGVDTISPQGQTVLAHFERADTCVVENIGVIAANAIAIDILNVVLDYTGNVEKKEVIKRWNK